MLSQASHLFLSLCFFIAFKMEVAITNVVITVSVGHNVWESTITILPYSFIYVFKHLSGGRESLGLQF